MKKHLLISTLLLTIISCTTLETPAQSLANAPKIETPKTYNKDIVLNIIWNKVKSEKIDLKIEIVNQMPIGIDLSKALLSLNYNGKEGSIVKSDFDRIVIGPKTKREGLIIFDFKPTSSLPEHKPFLLTLSNAFDFNGKKLEPSFVKGTFTYWKFTITP